MPDKLKLLFEFSLLWLLVFATSFFVDYIKVNKRNSRREIIIADSVSVNGIIKGKMETSPGTRSSVSAAYAYYWFYIEGKLFTGQTFHKYSGMEGDTIRIIYKKSDPEINIYAGELQKEEYNQSGPWFHATISMVIALLTYLFFNRKKKTSDEPIPV